MVGKWKPPFGPYDCELNALMFWSSQNNISLNLFYKYNWAFHFDNEHDLLRGSLSITNALSFFQEIYKVRVYQISFEEIPTGKIVILPLNARLLPYAKAYFQKTDLVHYVAAQKLNDEFFFLWDSSLEFNDSLSYKIVQSSWSNVGRKTCLLENSGEFISDKIDAIVPFYCQIDFKSIYSSSISEFTNRLRELVNSERDLINNEKYKKYFGYLTSILHARERHFEATTYSEYSLKILNGWRKVLKNYMKVSINGQLINFTIDAISEICEIEMNYLNSSFVTEVKI
ncbi:hypothetical protein QNH46_09135 [Paenibacillus woosongensis]|uniref:Uncharacterized protein n=1 Tax=Paenibacillus woosongensis TaxID=307580 RepID=A0AA95I6T9_9BACL|nr:hypothetical protein [Paenibacillus woosongensis]WHX50790.1 hypothetical protein QNH46_09135 [Paenibacillus woosongensis]